jgi:hypothetical protein
MRMRRSSFGFCLWAVLAMFAAMSCAGTGGSGADGDTGGNGSDGPLGCSLDTFAPNYLRATDPSTGERNSVHWWDHFPLRVYFRSNPTIQGQSLVDVSLAGFNAWSSVSGKTMAVQVSSPDNADVVVTFENLSAPPRNSDFLGSTSWTYNPSTLETVEAEVTLRTWNGITAGQVANGFRSTAQHEFGHAIFLAGHSPYEADSMYPFGNINTYTSLTTRDENSLLTTYCGSFQDRSSTLRAGDKLATRRIDCPVR